MKWASIIALYWVNHPFQFNSWQLGARACEIYMTFSIASFPSLLRRETQPCLATIPRPAGVAFLSPLFKTWFPPYCLLPWHSEPYVPTHTLQCKAPGYISPEHRAFQRYYYSNCAGRNISLWQSFMRKSIGAHLLQNITGWSIFLIDRFTPTSTQPCVYLLPGESI